jgi:hypothetical protein
MVVTRAMWRAAHASIRRPYDVARQLGIGVADLADLAERRRDDDDLRPSFTGRVSLTTADKLAGVMRSRPEPAPPAGPGLFPLHPLAGTRGHSGGWLDTKAA